MFIYIKKQSSIKSEIEYNPLLLYKFIQSFIHIKISSPTPVFLPGIFHGQRSLVSCSPQGQKDLDITEQTHRDTNFR